MKNPISALVPAAFSGLLLVIPLAILFLAVMEVYDLLKETAAFARLDLPFPDVINAVIYIVLVLAVLFSFCVLVGLLLETRPGKRFARFIEKSIADKIPLLGLVRNLTLSFSGAGKSELRAVEIDLQGSGTAALGFLMETLDDGRLVVFIPGAPAVTLGAIHIVPAERVRVLDTSIPSMANVSSQWGVGTRDLL